MSKHGRRCHTPHPSLSWTTLTNDNSLGFVLILWWGGWLNSRNSHYTGLRLPPSASAGQRLRYFPKLTRRGSEIIGSGCTHTKISLAFWDTFYTWNWAQITQYVILDTLFPNISRKKYWFSKCNISDQRRSPGRNTYSQMPISNFFEIVD